MCKKIGSALSEEDLIEESYKLRMSAFARKLIIYTKMFKENKEVFNT